MTIEEVAADGNCLYRAVARQLDHLDSGVSGDGSGDGNGNSNSSSSNGNDNDNGNDYTNIRMICADQMIKARDEYEPFADLTDSNVSSYEEYVEKVRGSSEWGGHVELRALSTALQKTIVVYSADSSPLFITNDNGDNDGDNVIRLSFHRKYYALGEHYNSVVPASSSGST